MSFKAARYEGATQSTAVTIECTVATYSTAERSARWIDFRARTEGHVSHYTAKAAGSCGLTISRRSRP
ncbi:hypothetical protein AWB93_22825 [Mycobacterium bohemicum]|uniref:Uncharacterized protein n=1 Tax=Mycobacterium bohemicum TaxID=56425 RepID=A0A1X1QWX3_MYCBE|nr:hypothetical protein AWB93_22825 [Mycobacterium bohemicum]